MCSSDLVLTILFSLYICKILVFVNCLFELASNIIVNKYLIISSLNFCVECSDGGSQYPRLVLPGTDYKLLNRQVKQILGCLHPCMLFVQLCRFFFCTLRCS